MSKIYFQLFFNFETMYIQDQPIILASKSPRRQELLTLMGLDFTVEVKPVDENFPFGLLPADAAIHISKVKAEAFGQPSGKMVITADTFVVIDNEILGKPKDYHHAVEMLQKLSGNQHRVFTGVTLVKKEKTISFCEQTKVYCRRLTPEEIHFYIANYQPFDKAGSYGIQDWFGINAVKRIEGSYTNVLGLPTEKLYGQLKNLS